MTTRRTSNGAENRPAETTQTAQRVMVLPVHSREAANGALGGPSEPRHDIGLAVAPTTLLDGRWYTTEQLAALLSLDPSSLRRWRTAEPPEGPPFVRLSARTTMYSAIDVEQWLRDRRIDPRRAAA